MVVASGRTAAVSCEELFQKFRTECTLCRCGQFPQQSLLRSPLSRETSASMTELSVERLHRVHTRYTEASFGRLPRSPALPSGSDLQLSTGNLRSASSSSIFVPISPEKQRPATPAHIWQIEGSRAFPVTWTDSPLLAEPLKSQDRVPVLRPSSAACRPPLPFMPTSTASFAASRVNAATPSYKIHMAAAPKWLLWRGPRLSTADSRGSWRMNGQRAWQEPMSLRDTTMRPLG